MESLTRSTIRQQARSKKKKGFAVKGIRLVFDQLIRFRYVIGLIAIVVIVSFNLNGSSMNAWNRLVSQRVDDKKTDVLWGETRPIRSDEWMVQTPFYLSQAENDYPVKNPDFSLNGQNMIIAYNSPVKDITVIGKPFNWGFFFLGRDRGLSFYWAFKIVAMVLLGFELAMILSRRNKYLSFLSGFWLAFAPGVQWWFMQHVGDLIFFTMGLLIAFYYYFAKHENRLLRAGMVALATICGIGFVLVIYPAHQVMLAYLVLFWVIGLVIYYARRTKWDRLDLVLIIPALLLTGFVLVHFYSISKGALDAALNTIYPGRRIDTGGDLKVEELFYFLTNWKIPFKDTTFTNNSEIASFYHFLPLVLLTMPVIWWKKVKFKDNYLGIILGVYCFFSFLWMQFGAPKWLAKATLLSYVPTERSIMTFSFAAALLSIWFIGNVWRTPWRAPIAKVVLSGIFTGFMWYAIAITKMSRYFTPFEWGATVVVVALLSLSLLFAWKKTFLILFGAVILASGLFVNPVNQGTGAIYKKKLAVAIMKEEKKHPDKLWLSEGSLYNFTPALGVHSFNTVRFYPDMKAWKKIDPKEKQEKIYNRYAHTNAYVTNLKTDYKLIHPDSFVVNLNFKDVAKLGIDYVVSQRPLEDYNAMGLMQFKKIYGPDKDENRIYKIVGERPEDTTEEPTPPVNPGTPTVPDENQNGIWNGYNGVGNGYTDENTNNGWSNGTDPATDSNSGYGSTYGNDGTTYNNDGTVYNNNGGTNNGTAGYTGEGTQQQDPNTVTNNQQQTNGYDAAAGQQVGSEGYPREQTQGNAINGAGQ